MVRLIETGSVAVAVEKNRDQFHLPIFSKELSASARAEDGGIEK